MSTLTIISISQSSTIILWVAASVIVLNVLVVVVVVVLVDKLHPFRMYSSLVFVHTYIHTYIHTFELSVTSFPFQEMSVYSNPEKHIAEAIAAHNESLKESLNSIKITNADRFFFLKNVSLVFEYVYIMYVCMYVCMYGNRKKTSSRSTRKGQFGADLAEDEDWVERLKQVGIVQKQCMYGTLHRSTCMCGT